MKVEADVGVAGNADIVVRLAIQTVAGGAWNYCACAGIDTFVGNQHRLVLTNRSVHVEASCHITSQTDLVVGLAVTTVAGGAWDHGTCAAVDTFVCNQHSLVLAQGALKVKPSSSVT